jgi:hypothetical protein
MSQGFNHPLSSSFVSGKYRDLDHVKPASGEHNAPLMKLNSVLLAPVVGKITLWTSKLGSDLHVDFDRKKITF